MPKAKTITLQPNQSVLILTEKGDDTINITGITPSHELDVPVPIHAKFVIALHDLFKHSPKFPQEVLDRWNSEILAKGLNPSITTGPLH